MGTRSGVGRTETSTPSDREFVMQRVFDAPRETMWKMWTVPEHVQRWMLGPEGWTMPVCEMDVRVGGSWRCVWQKGEGGERMVISGVYHEVTPPSRLVHTESWGDPWPETLNTLELVEEGAGRTRMISTMLFPSKQARDDATATGMTEGADRSFDLLAEYVAGL